jgi:NADH-quinone oxidoreductase subunit L
MLDIVWILPALMVGAFVVTLFFGKRLPKKGAEIGTAAVLLCLVLSLVSVFQWSNRETVVHPTEHSAEVGETPHADEVPAGAEGGTEHGDEASPVAEETHSTEHGLSAGLAPRLSVSAAEEGGHGGIREPVIKQVSWYRDGNIDIGLGIHVDGFAVAMLFVVSFISLCVHVFSIEYLRGDKRFTHYFAALNLFTAAMLWMVQSATTLGLFFGWELMGLCSFLLIGHWWEDKNNSDAALKAFLTTRTGDIGLLIGIIIMFFASGKTFDIATANAMALDGSIGHGVLLVAACCLFLGVVGKSAQFPLHTWLPDAMAGPTPASALIHAATMVVAGVYLFARLYGVFWQGFSIHAGGMNLGAWIGGITVVMAAGLAFVQTDIKKVLAYSTVSQLGYMILGLSVGAWVGAIFHLVTHAFFKALLFQGAGSIAHSGSHHSFEMERMGGLKKYMPKTYWTFFVGYLALAGLPIFSGFWSKDEILNAADANGFRIAWVAGSLGAFMTAAYMTRVMAKTFWGENRLHLFHDGHETHATSGDHDVHAAHVVDTAHDQHASAADHEVTEHDAEHHAADDGPHESPGLITWPLIALAVMATFVGFLNWPFIKKFWFEKFIANATFEESVVARNWVRPFNWGVAVPSVVLALLGIAVGYWYNVVKKGDLGLVRRGGPAAWVHKVLKNKYYLDHLWTGIVVNGIKGPIAQTAYWFNQHILDGVINNVGKGAVATGRAVYDQIDQRVIDGIVNGSGISASTGGNVLRKLQTGRVQNYAAVFLASVGLLGLALALFL